MSGVLPHEHYVRRAIELGKHNPRLPFAALIVDRVSGNVLAEGWNRTDLL
jgi:tRNA(adenine34) deaminase